MRLTHPKAIAVWYDLTSQFFDSLLQSMIQYGHSKLGSFEWQCLDTWLNLHSQGFRDQWQPWYLGRFATFYHHQTMQTLISMYLRSDSCC